MDKVPNGLATFRLGIFRMLVCSLVPKRPLNPSTGICFDFAYTTDLLGDASLNIPLTPLVVQPLLWPSIISPPSNWSKEAGGSAEIGVTCAASAGLPLRW